MRNGKRGRYTLEFKLEAVRLVESGQSSIAEAAGRGATLLIRSGKSRRSLFRNDARDTTRSETSARLLR
jgi:transposase-like protein